MYLLITKFKFYYIFFCKNYFFLLGYELSNLNKDLKIKQYMVKLPKDLMMRFSLGIVLFVFSFVVFSSQIYAEEITVKEWEIPTPNSQPHDVIVDESGIIWFTEINANKIGKFNPTTEQFTEYQIPTPSSRPHGLVADGKGNIWFTEVGAGKIGKLDSKTGSIEEYSTPTKNSGPHTPIVFDNFLWFTEQSASKIARLDMNTGKIQEFPTSTPSANPYGITVDKEGNAWFAELRGDKIGKVDAITGNVTEFSPPTNESGPRRIAIDSNGILWFTEYNSGKIASFNPKTQEMKEYETSSKSSGPYAIWVDAYDNVWFSMTGIYRVGKLVQETQMIHEYGMPSPQTHIKFIRTDSKGNVWFPNYNNNKIGVIYAKTPITISDQVASSSDMGNGNRGEDKKSSDTKSLAYFPPPLKQIQEGIEPMQVTCTEGLELVLKVSNGQPACVKPSSVSKLIERGWAMHILPDYEKSENNNSVIFSLGDLQVETLDVNYHPNSTGYLARPANEGDFPSVIMIHEWWGLNENIKEMAEKLASHGYTVLAVDLYGGEVATTSEEARQLRSAFGPEQWIENMNSAVSYVSQNYDPKRIGSIGWCFGGGQSLSLALNNNDLDATVIYYGQLVTEKETLSQIDWPILGIFAGLDQGIPPEQVKEFETALNELQIPNEIYIYPNVNHAFANPSGDRYAPAESKDAWSKTLDFLDENLK